MDVNGRLSAGAENGNGGRWQGLLAPAKRPMTVSPRGIERRLRARLRRAGRNDLAVDAVEAVRLTDDGSTVYVHIFVRPTWAHYRAGAAYPLAFADHPDLRSLPTWRTFLSEAALLLDDDFDAIVRWLDGT